MSELNDEFSVEDIKIHSAEVVEKPVQASPYAGAVEIIVDAAAWNDMNRHACEDLRHEAGGVMLGGIYDHHGTLVVRITTAVAAHEAVNSVASIQFTYEAWSQMEKERKRSAPDEKLIGWYHTHPGFSAFFSDTDRFLHEHFFPQPWHVALVIDPLQGDYRFYRWENGRVQAVKEFLLKIDEWPGPQPPLNAVLTTALRKAAKQAEADDPGSATPLQPVMQKLLAGVRRGNAERSSSDLLSLIVSCAEVTPEQVAEARKRTQVERPADGPIHFADLQVCSNNTNAEGAISIARRLLVQQHDRQTLHFHSLDEHQPLCAHLEVPLSIRDLTVNDRGHVLILTRGRDQALYQVEPPLPRTPEKRGKQTISVDAVEIDWGTQARPAQIGKLIAAHHDLFLLTRTELWALAGNPSPVPRFEFGGVHHSKVCGWDSFEELADWTCDPIGNLYLLSAERKEIWRYERLSGLWSRFIAGEKLDDPRSLAAGSSVLSIYDAGKAPAIVQFSLADGRLLGRRRLDADVQQLQIWHLFSDGEQRLYLATAGHVFKFQ